MGQNISRRRSYTPGKTKNTEVAWPSPENGEGSNTAVEVGHGLDSGDGRTAVNISSLSTPGDTSTSSSTPAGKTDKRKRFRVGFPLRRTPSGRWSRKRRSLLQNGVRTVSGAASPYNTDRPETTDGTDVLTQQQHVPTNGQVAGDHVTGNGDSHSHLNGQDKSIVRASACLPLITGDNHSHLNGQYKSTVRASAKSSGRRGSQRSSSRRKKKEKHNSKEKKKKQNSSVDVKTTGVIRQEMTERETDALKDAPGEEVMIQTGQQVSHAEPIDWGVDTNTVPHADQERGSTDNQDASCKPAASLGDDKDGSLRDIRGFSTRAYTLSTRGLLADSGSLTVQPTVNTDIEYFKDNGLGETVEHAPETSPQPQLQTTSCGEKTQQKCPSGSIPLVGNAAFGHWTPISPPALSPVEGNFSPETPTQEHIGENLPSADMFVAPRLSGVCSVTVSGATSSLFVFTDYTSRAAPSLHLAPSAGPLVASSVDPSSATEPSPVMPSVDVSLTTEPLPVRPSVDFSSRPTCWVDWDDNTQISKESIAQELAAFGEQSLDSVFLNPATFDETSSLDELVPHRLAHAPVVVAVSPKESVVLDTAISVDNTKVSQPADLGRVTWEHPDSPLDPATVCVGHSLYTGPLSGQLSSLPFCVDSDVRLPVDLASTNPDYPQVSLPIHQADTDCQSSTLSLPLHQADTDCQSSTLSLPIHLADTDCQSSTLSLPLHQADTDCQSSTLSLPLHQADTDCQSSTLSLPLHQADTDCQTSTLSLPCDHASINGELSGASSRFLLGYRRDEFSSVPLSLDQYIINPGHYKLPQSMRGVFTSGELFSTSLPYLGSVSNTHTDLQPSPQYDGSNCEFLETTPDPTGSQVHEKSSLSTQSATDSKARCLQTSNGAITPVPDGESGSQSVGDLLTFCQADPETGLQEQTVPALQSLFDDATLVRLDPALDTEVDTSRWNVCPVDEILVGSQPGVDVVEQVAAQVDKFLETATTHQAETCRAPLNGYNHEDVAEKTIEHHAAKDVGVEAVDTIHENARTPEVKASELLGSNLINDFINLSDINKVECDEQTQETEYINEQQKDLSAVNTEADKERQHRDQHAAAKKELGQSKGRQLIKFQRKLTDWFHKTDKKSQVGQTEKVNRQNAQDDTLTANGETLEKSVLLEAEEAKEVSVDPEMLVSTVTKPDVSRVFSRTNCIFDIKTEPLDGTTSPVSSCIFSELDILPTRVSLGQVSSEPTHVTTPISCVQVSGEPGSVPTPVRPSQVSDEPGSVPTPVRPSQVSDEPGSVPTPVRPSQVSDEPGSVPTPVRPSQVSDEPGSVPTPVRPSQVSDEPGNVPTPVRPSQVPFEPATTSTPMNPSQVTQEPARVAHPMRPTSPSSYTYRLTSPSSDGEGSSFLKKIALGSRLRTAILRKKSTGSPEDYQEEKRISLTRPKSIGPGDWTPSSVKWSSREPVGQDSSSTDTTYTCMKADLFGASYEIQNTVGRCETDSITRLAEHLDINSVEHSDINPVEHLDINHVEHLDINPVEHLDVNPVEHLDINPVEHLDVSLAEHLDVNTICDCNKCCVPEKNLPTPADDNTDPKSNTDAPDSGVVPGAESVAEENSTTDGTGVVSTDDQDDTCPLLGLGESTDEDTASLPRDVGINGDMIDSPGQEFTCDKPVLAKSATAINCQQPVSPIVVAGLIQYWPVLSEADKGYSGKMVSENCQKVEINRGEPAIDELETELNHQQPVSHELETELNHQQPVSHKLETELNHEQPVSHELETELNHQQPATDELEAELNHQQPVSHELETELNHQQPVSDEMETELNHQQPVSDELDAELNHQQPVSDKLEAGLNCDRSALCETAGELNFDKTVLSQSQTEDTCHKIIIFQLEADINCESLAFPEPEFDKNSDISELASANDLDKTMSEFEVTCGKTVLAEPDVDTTCHAAVAWESQGGVSCDKATLHESEVELNCGNNCDKPAASETVAEVNCNKSLFNEIEANCDKTILLEPEIGVYCDERILQDTESGINCDKEILAQREVGVICKKLVLSEPAVEADCDKVVLSEPAVRADCDKVVLSEPAVEADCDKVVLSEPEAEADCDKAVLSEPAVRADCDKAVLSEPEAEADCDKVVLSEPEDEADCDKAVLSEPAVRADCDKAVLSEPAVRADCDKAVLSEPEAEADCDKVVLSEPEAEADCDKAVLSEPEVELDCDKAVLSEPEDEADCDKAVLSEPEAELDSHKVVLSEPEVELDCDKVVLSEPAVRADCGKTPLSEGEAEMKCNKSVLTESEAEIKCKIAVLTESESEIKFKKAVLTESEAEMKCNKADLTESESEIKCNNAVLTESEAEIKCNNAVLTESEAEIKCNNAVLTESESEIKCNNAVLTESEAEIKYNKAVVTEPDTQIRYNRIVLSGPGPAVVSQTGAGNHEDLPAVSEIEFRITFDESTLSESRAQINCMRPALPNTEAAINCDNLALAGTQEGTNCDIFVLAEPGVGINCDQVRSAQQDAGTVNGDRVMFPRAAELVSIDPRLVSTNITETLKTSTLCIETHKHADIVGCETGSVPAKATETNTRGCVVGSAPVEATENHQEGPQSTSPEEILYPMVAAADVSVHLSNTSMLTSPATAHSYGVDSTLGKCLEMSTPEHTQPTSGQQSLDEVWTDMELVSSEGDLVTCDVKNTWSLSTEDRLCSTESLGDSGQKLGHPSVRTIAEYYIGITADLHEDRPGTRNGHDTGTHKEVLTSLSAGDSALSGHEGIQS